MGNSTRAASNNTRGKSSGIVINVKWPKVSRLVPLATVSLEIVITQTGVAGPANLVSTTKIPAGQVSTTISPLPAADLTLTATAFDDNDASIAQGSQDIVTQVNVSSIVTINMESTIDHLVISPPNPTAAVGGTTQLMATGMNTLNEMVLLTPSKLTWSSSNTNIAFFADPTKGVVTGVTNGPTTISVEDAESLKTGAAVLTVQPITGFMDIDWLITRTALGPWSGTRTLTMTGLTFTKTTYDSADIYTATGGSYIVKGNEVDVLSNSTTTRTETGTGGFDGSSFDPNLGNGTELLTGYNALQVYVVPSTQTCNVYLSFRLNYENVTTYPPSSAGGPYYTSVVMPGTVSISSDKISISFTASYSNPSVEFGNSQIVETFTGTIQTSM